MCVCTCVGVCVCVCWRCGRVLLSESVGIREENGLQQTICQPLFSSKKAIVRLYNVFVCFPRANGSAEVNAKLIK